MMYHPTALVPHPSGVRRAEDLPGTVRAFSV